MWLWALFIFLAVLLVALILLLLFYPSLNALYFRKNYVRIYGKKVYRIALDRDLYLINRLKLPMNGDIAVSLDHVLFGTKYIYVISDRYYDGALNAKEEDKSWVYFPRRRKKGGEGKKYVDNPLKENRQNLNKLARATGLDRRLFLPIVLINNDCVIESFQPKSRKDFLCHVRNLKKLIAALEGRDVAEINDAQLQEAVQDIAKLNLTRKERSS